MTVVDRGELGDAEAFRSRDNRRVRDAERKACVLPHELGDPDPVSGSGVRDCDFVGNDGVEESSLSLRPTCVCAR